MSEMISIIVPIYNVKNLLERCIRSIEHQTYKNYEVLMIDDGSTDGSGELADSLAQKSDKFFCFHKNNGGLSDARNYGIERAKGDYLLFIDSDDVLNSDFCKILIDSSKKYNADIVSTDLIEFNKNEEIAEFDSKEYNKQVKILYDNQILKEYFVPEEKRIIYHGLCMKIYKKELFDDIRFDVGRLHEDVFITYKLLDKCKCFVYLNLPYYYYYKKNDNSISNNYKKKNFLDEYDAINEIQKYFEGKKTIEQELKLFCIYHYLSMINRIQKQKDCEINSVIREIRVWIIKNVVILKKINMYKKIKIIFATLLTSVYFTLREKKNERK